MIYKVTLNGKTYEVEVEKGEAVIQAEYEAALPVAAPAAPAAPVAPAAATAPAPAAPAAAPAAAAGANSVTAPLPGNINEVKVAVGQTVKAGTVLVILEAMKMENEVVAPKDGTVSRVFVQKGAVVQTGDPLVNID